MFQSHFLKHVFSKEDAKAKLCDVRSKEFRFNYCICSFCGTACYLKGCFCYCCCKGWFNCFVFNKVDFVQTFLIGTETGFV